VTRARRAFPVLALALLGSLAAAGLLAVAPAAASGLPAADLDLGAIVVDVPRLSFEELLSIPEVAALARAGGGGLLANPGEIGPSPLGPGAVDAGRQRFLRLDPDGEGGLETVGRDVMNAIGGFPTARVLVVVYSSERSPAMVADKDELPGIVVAFGAPGDLLHVAGPQGSLTSDSTRRDGVVVGGDVRATIGRFIGATSDPVPGGEPIEVIGGPPPFELHERYLAQRQLYVPIGTAAALYVTVVGVVATVFLAAGLRVPRRARRVAGWATISVPMLAVGMLAAGHLPVLTYATAVPMIAIVTVFGTMAFSPLERSDPTLVLAGIGIAVLALAALEAAVGWSGLLTPLLGGSQLDGGRFFGLPNVAIGLLVGGALWVAQRLRTAGGFWLLCGLGLFAGLPVLGANLGGAVTSFAAAGLWVAVRERERLGAWRGLAVALGVTAAGAAVILVAHAISPVETHITRFEENSGGIAGIVATFGDRLQVGFDLIARSPAALVPVLGLPVVLLVLLRPPGAFRSTFERRPAWRDAAVVTILAGIVAYVVNDSGPAAAGLAFGLGLGGALGMSLLAPQGKMVEP
jgi:hypothetical protein